ncbi:MAG TPA: type VII secretion protein EccB [Pseudonocardiaceae bacterium]|jgi:type VII secretion protein EccB|nr:type VII secretion protein EccB [Pseudonocardiaceae bacterium]
MPSTPTTKSQVQAYRFVLRRMESALVRRDPVMLHDPMRSHKRSTVVGAILGVVGLVGFLLFGVLKPAPTVPPSGIVIAQPSGQVYVVSQNPHELIPVFNVASGRLLLAAQQQQQQNQQGQSAAGSTGGQSAPTVVTPVTVDDDELTKIPIGVMTGIPDGPTVLPAPNRAPTTWAVCDSINRDLQAPDPTTHAAPRTAVLVGENDIGANLTTSQALLVSSDGGNTLYLVYGLKGTVNSRNDSAVRAQIDASDTHVLTAFGITNRDSYRVVSPAVLNAIPSVAEIEDPATGLGNGTVPPQLANLQLTMGESISVQQVGGSTNYYIVVPGGIEQVTNATAQIARFENSNGLSAIKAVPPQAIVDVNQVQYGDKGGLTVNTTNYPTVVPTIIGAAAKPVMCLGWSADYSDPAQPLAKTRVTVATNLRLPADPNNPSGQMSMAQIGEGTSTGQVNAFFMNPTLGGVVVRAATNAGEFGSGQIDIVDPRGVVFSVPDLYTAQVLGVADARGVVPPGPQSIISQLPLGGSPLDMQSVQQAVNGMTLPPGAVRYSQPQQPQGGN